ncbi:MAG TPA: hypothetical protein VJT84_02140 [Gaiellaceae bacterium]|nr:hypothetical protein [Gaiellaceae bacterium]
MTEYPSSVWIVTLSPCVGIAPANVTRPARGASAGSPALPPTSIPRCCPPVYGLSPNLKAWSTGPDTGHVHAAAAGATASEQSTRAVVVRRSGNM